MEVRLLERVGTRQAELLEQVGLLARELGLSAYLVGGAVRDALLGCSSLDLDVTVEGDALPFAARLAEITGGSLTSHDRFGTAVLELEDLHLDFATARRETYPEPGALPVVEPAAIADDLVRRDFAVNTLAIRLDRDADQLFDPLGGYQDLQAGILRGLHERTFSDDPTRIIRAARYAARFCWQIEPQTLNWLLAAVQANTLATVTLPRIWGELQRLLSEDTAPAAVELLGCWGALDQLGLGCGCPGDMQGVWQAAKALQAPAHDRSLAALALLTGPKAAAMAAGWGLTVGERKAVTAAAEAVSAPPAALVAGETLNSDLRRLADALPLAALLAICARHPFAWRNVERLRDLQNVCPDINGEDLQAEGFAPSPGFRPALEAALAAKLDRGADRAAQLSTALAVLADWHKQHEL
ncbi:MAG: hypothetical protein ABFE08_06245 [Armatimonadia bacterium]